MRRGVPTDMATPLKISPERSSCQREFTNVDVQSQALQTSDMMADDVLPVLRIEILIPQLTVGDFVTALLLDSRVLRDQQLNERRQQRFASLADVVHELEEPQVDREFLLGNAPMRTQPTA
jgi:hypothetical protein